MLLRLNLALTNFRQLDVTVRDDINAAELNALAHSIANATHGHQDLVVVQCVEELGEPQSVLELFHPEGCPCKICER